MNAKMILGLIVSLAAASANAQGTSSSKLTPSEPERLGLGITAAYMNITSATVKFSSSSGSQVSNGSEQLGMAGVRGSYLFDFKKTFSIEPGTAFLRSINKSEAEKTISVVAIDTNFGWMLSDSWTLFGGPALTRFDVANASDSDATVDFAFGGQVGIGYQKKGLLVKVGYADYGYSASFTSTNPYSRSANLQARLAGGFAQVGYMF